MRLRAGTLSFTPWRTFRSEGASAVRRTALALVRCDKAPCGVDCSSSYIEGLGDEMTDDADPVLDPLRLLALTETGVLDTAPEQAFDDVARLASRLCDAPTALVSLVDQDRQWFKARVGFDPPQTDLGSSVCRHGLAVDDLLVIPDLTADPRTRDNPLVAGAPRIRFYAGAPLRLVDGQVAGMLCVIDVAARPDGLTPDQAEDLRALARQTAALLDSRRATAGAIEDRRLSLQAARFAAALIRIGDVQREQDDPASLAFVGAEVMGRALDADRAGFGLVDLEAETVSIEKDWTAPGVASIAGVHRFRDFGAFIDDLRRGEIVLIPDVRADSRTAAFAPAFEALGIHTLFNVPLMEGGRLRAVQFAHYAQAKPLPEGAAAFIRNVADRTAAGVARLVAEQRQQTLNAEIGHRLKNLITMVQAIASQTLRGVDDRASVAALEARLLAMGAAQDVLFQSDWQPAELDGLVDRVLAAAGVRDRCDVSGPPIRIGPQSTLAASLLLHELATNAVKHGALSNDVGRVRLDWSADGDTLRLDWRESGGPIVVPPARRGLGTRLMSSGLGEGGAVDTAFHPEGLHARFEAPLVAALAN